MNEDQHEIGEEMKGLGWRVSLSILVGIGWLVFLVLWLFFYAKVYSWEKNVAIFLLSLFVIIGVLGIPWAIWGLRHRTLREKEMWTTKGFRWRTWVSGIVVLVNFIFMIYWFWYLATPYDVYQNIAIFLVSFLIMGGILGALWAGWGIKYGHHYHHRDEMKKE